MLLRLERNDALDFFLFHCRQLDEAREDRLRGGGVIDRAAFEVELAHHLAQGGGDLRVARAVVHGIGEDFAQAIAVEDEAAVWFGMELGQADGVRTEVETKNALGGRHERTNPKSPFLKPKEIPNSKSRFQPLPWLIGF